MKHIYLNKNIFKQSERKALRYRLHIKRFATSLL